MPEHFDAEAARGLNVVVQFHIGGSREDVHHVVVRDGSIEIARGPHSKPTMSFTLADEVFVALATGDLSPQLAFLDRRVQIAGDVGLASRMLEMLGIGRR